MKLTSSYSVKIKHYRYIFNDTIKLYRGAVDFFIGVCLAEWDAISAIVDKKQQLSYMEKLTHTTKDNPTPAYDFDSAFYKFPCYLRRAAINDAIGKVATYKSNLANFEAGRSEKCPSEPKAGHTFPAMYKKDCYQRTNIYTAKLKVFIRNTWDWLEVQLNKGDADYIARHCWDKSELAPTLRKRGREWFLDFPFEQKVDLCGNPETIVAVDLGINNACVCSVMRADGTILGRKFLSLPREQDSLLHAVNRIRKAQQHGARRTPRLWAAAKGINDDIAVKTANFIIGVAEQYEVHAVVFEHLDLQGKKRGSKKQRLHLWKAQYVQAMVAHKAHQRGLRFSRVCAWGTSKLAFDGSGEVVRGIDGNHSLCRFQNGKIYNCDLSASYNIGARYFIRETLKSLSATARLALQAKVPAVAKRTTCTFSTLLSLNAALAA